MLDRDFVCEHLEEVRANCRNRQVKVNLEPVARLAAERKRLITETQLLQQRQNEVSRLTPQEKDPARKQALIAEGKELKGKVARIEDDRKKIESDLEAALKTIPNMSHPNAPVGTSERDNKVIRTWGQRPSFDFKPASHVEIAEKLDLADFEAGTRVSGPKFYFLKNEGALLELALIHYAVRTLIDEGFTPVITPDIARQEVLEGIGFIPRGPESNVYALEETDTCLVATAEITLGGMHREQIMEPGKLPIRYVGLSHCFRREAGAAGAETRGLFRVHQFTKVEMFVFCTPEESEKWHLELLRIEEKLFQGLAIPYQVVDICTADLGGPACRKYDIEAWMAGRRDGQGEYAEVTSTSNCTDYQARRLNIRYRPANQKGTRFVHTLNGTAIAVSRAIVAILENNQQADGSVTVPEVLRPYLGKERIGPKK